MSTEAESLDLLERAIKEYLKENPTNGGAHKDGWLIDPVTIPKPLRDGVIFYSTGWGWRLRKNWRSALDAKKAPTPDA